MKVEIHLAGRQYESVWFVAEGATSDAVKAELETLVSEVQAMGWAAYEALVALRDVRNWEKSAPEVAAPQAALPTAEELIKSELGGKVIDVVESTTKEGEKPFWERKSTPEPAAPAAVPAAPAAKVSFF